MTSSLVETSWHTTTCLAAVLSLSSGSYCKRRVRFYDALGNAERAQPHQERKEIGHQDLHRQAAEEFSTVLLDTGITADLISCCDLTDQRPRHYSPEVGLLGTKICMAEQRPDKLMSVTVSRLTIFVDSSSERARCGYCGFVGCSLPSVCWVLGLLALFC